VLDEGHQNAREDEPPSRLQKEHERSLTRVSQDAGNSSNPLPRAGIARALFLDGLMLSIPALFPRSAALHLDP